MNRNDEPRDHEPNDYDPSYERLHDDAETDPDEGPSSLWPTHVGTLAPFYGTDEAERPHDEAGDSWLDDGLITLLLVVGVVLFLFPEPVTSSIGFFLVLTGAVAWLVDLVG